MRSLIVTSDQLQVRFTLFEKLAGLVTDIDLPLVDVKSCTVIHFGITAVRGRRAPGFELPGRLKVGTWVRGGANTLVCVRRNEPAMSIAVGGQRYTSLLIGTPDAATVARDLASWAGGHPTEDR